MPDSSGQNRSSGHTMPAFPRGLRQLQLVPPCECSWAPHRGLASVSAVSLNLEAAVCCSFGIRNMVPSFFFRYSCITRFCLIAAATRLF